MAAAIQEATKTDVEVTPGHRGEFTVRVNGNVVAQKSRETGFPDDKAIVTAVTTAL